MKHKDEEQRRVCKKRRKRWIKPRSYHIKQNALAAGGKNIDKTCAELDNGIKFAIQQSFLTIYEKSTTYVNNSAVGRGCACHRHPLYGVGKV